MNVPRKRRPTALESSSHSTATGHCVVTAAAAVLLLAACGAPPQTSPPPEKCLLTTDELHAAMHEDLESIEPAERRFVRYLVLNHLCPDADPSLGDQGIADANARLDSHRQGVSKLLNSLSWHPEVTPPTAIADAHGSDTILRVHLDDYQWGLSIWNGIARAYPYAVRHDSAIARAVYRQTGCDIPFVKADWFAYHVGRPPMYHDVLGLPAARQELEAFLGIDVEAGISAQLDATYPGEHLVLRAGFQQSGVSGHNRVVERHTIGTYEGAYWLSYDFAGSQGDQSIFRDPIDFQEDGGEIVFNLPNGLQAYLLVGADGTTIDCGPLEVVQNDDPRTADPRIVNGFVCGRCHYEGIILRGDEIRNITESDSGFRTADEANRVFRLYPGSEVVLDYMLDDQNRNETARARAGARRVSTRDEEQIAALARTYEQPVVLTQVAADFGMNVDAFRELPALTQLRIDHGELAQLFSGERVPVERGLYEGLFRDIACRLGVGTALVHGDGSDRCAQEDAFVECGGIELEPKRVPAEEICQ